MQLQLIFKSVLNMSFTGSIVICFVLIARMLLSKTPKVFSYALWTVVLFRLLCPVSFTSTFSLLHFTHAIVSKPEAVITAVEYAPVLDIYQYSHEIIGEEAGLSDYEYIIPDPQSNQKITENRTEFTPTPDAVSQQATAEPVREPIYYAAYIWLMGMGVMLIYNICSYRMLGKKIIGAVRLRKNIYLADHIPSPFVMGILRPKIYLPSALNPSERKYIIAHERYHIRRKDHIIKLLAYGALCIHWFNPLVWIAFAMSGKDMEMSCDEAVIRKYGPKIRADYSASLLRLATGHRIIAGTPLAFGEGDTKGRVLNMAKWKKPKFWVVIVAAIVCICVLVACAMNPAENNQQADMNEMTSPSNDAQAPLWITEMDPLEACQKAVDELKNYSSYYILYEFSSDDFEDSGTTEYRRHGQDLLIDSPDQRFFLGNIYFEGVYGMNYGDYWALEDQKSDFDPNAWLERWAPDKKEVDHAQLVNENTIVFDAAWPHALHSDLQYQGTFTYTFNPDGSLNFIQREYVLYENGEAVSGTVDKITLMDEEPEDTYAAIKSVADKCILASELETYRAKAEEIDQIPSNKTNYDTDFLLGEGQMRWHFFGKTWQFALGVKDATATSATVFHCESGEGHQSLVAEDSFWLETFKDGKWCYLDSSIPSANTQTVNINVTWNQSDSYTIDWSDIYGTLKPGYYRIGRYYTATMNSGESETKVCYAKFRLMDDEMMAQVSKCEAALNALLASESYHIKVIEKTDNNELNPYITKYYWKYNENYLSFAEYLLSNGRTESKGSMLQYGIGYSLCWEGNSPASPLNAWSSNTYMDDFNFTLWTLPLELYDSLVEEAVTDGNSVRVVMKYDFNDTISHTEVVFTFDDQGKLSGLEHNFLPTRNCSEEEKISQLKMEVIEMASTEIFNLMQSQEIRTPLPFSYEKDVADYPDAQKSGFINTNPQVISDVTDAIRIASTECTLPIREPNSEQYNITEVLYDSEAKMWKVILTWSQNTDTPQYIYLDDQGITQMIVTY